MKKKTRILQTTSLMLSGLFLLSAVSLHSMNNAEGIVEIVTMPDGSFRAVRVDAEPNGVDTALVSIDPGGTVVALSNGAYGFANSGPVNREIVNRDMRKANSGNAIMVTDATRKIHEPQVVATDAKDDADEAMFVEASFQRPLLIGAAVVALSLAFLYRDRILTFLGFGTSKVSDKEGSSQDALSSDTPAGSNFDTSLGGAFGDAA